MAAQPRWPLRRPPCASPTWNPLPRRLIRLRTLDTARDGPDPDVRARISAAIFEIGNLLRIDAHRFRRQSLGERLPGAIENGSAQRLHFHWFSVAAVRPSCSRSSCWITCSQTRRAKMTPAQASIIQSSHCSRLGRLIFRHDNCTPMRFRPDCCDYFLFRAMRIRPCYPDTQPSAAADRRTAACAPVLPCAPAKAAALLAIRASLLGRQRCASCAATESDNPASKSVGAGQAARRPAAPPRRHTEPIIFQQMPARLRVGGRALPAVVDPLDEESRCLHWRTQRTRENASCAAACALASARRSRRSSNYACRMQSLALQCCPIVAMFTASV